MKHNHIALGSGVQLYWLHKIKIADAAGHVSTVRGILQEIAENTWEKMFCKSV